MSTDWTGVASVISSIAALVTATGVIIGVVIARKGSARLNEQAAVLTKVEKQGNSVSLELKRTNMVYSRRLALATVNTESGTADKAIADDAQRVYEEAKLAAERDAKV